MADLGALTVALDGLGLPAVNLGGSFGATQTALDGLGLPAVNLGGSFGATQTALDGLGTRRIMPFWQGGNTLAIDAGGVISGAVMVQGVPAPYSKVRLHWRASAFLVDGVLSDKNGNFTFSGLDRNSPRAYYAVALTEQDYNALIYDKLTAV
jgi:hypothetical protein